MNTSILALVARLETLGGDIHALTLDVVLWRRRAGFDPSRPFVTHNWDTMLDGRATIYTGHYDLDEVEGWKDFYERNKPLP